MSPQSENAHLSCSSEPREFSLEERKVLLNLAHRRLTLRWKPVQFP